MLDALREAELMNVQMTAADAFHVSIERRGATDPGSWVVAREQYR